MDVFYNQEKAMEKLNKFTVKVAYPDKWKDYSKLKSFLKLKEELYTATFRILVNGSTIKT
jgi:predicted metalloendopeptidase